MPNMIFDERSFAKKVKRVIQLIMGMVLLSPFRINGFVV